MHRNRKDRGPGRVRASWMSAGCGLLLAMGMSGWPGAAGGAEEGWQALFNGKDLAGWKAEHGVTFEAQGGALRLVKGTGWLRSEKEYGDFVMEVELRPLVERYDSGLFFRVGLDGKPWPTDGWQINLRRDKWGNLVRGFKDVARSEAEGPDVEENGPWSKFRLEVRGMRATLDVDGKRVWEFGAIDRAKGYVGIQAEERSFEFRNFQIRELAADGGK